jgi:hypothetical protein
VADRAALAAYGARAAELQEELQEARDNDDAGAEERIRRDVQMLAEEVRRCYSIIDPALALFGLLRHRPFST